MGPVTVKQISQEQDEREKERKACYGRQNFKETKNQGLPVPSVFWNRSVFERLRVFFTSASAPTPAPAP